MERDLSFLFLSAFHFISTHTLTWSVTGCRGSPPAPRNFNSHAHVERDGYVRKYCQNYIISTHTLTWSVTGYLSFLQYTIPHFNSHAHVERDGFIVEFSITSLSFQLTRSRGAWRLRCGIFQSNINFNSHAHVERDVSVYINANASIISTHTLTWSVTFNMKRERLNTAISTHTLTWSVTLKIW